MFYRLIHILDPLIALESLYRYVRKWHALDARRYALISMTQIVPLLFVLLSLEFMPRRRHLWSVPPAMGDSLIGSGRPVTRQHILTLRRYR